MAFSTNDSRLTWRKKGGKGGRKRRREEGKEEGREGIKKEDLRGRVAEGISKRGTGILF